MSLRDLLGPASVPDPVTHTGPAIVEDHNRDVDHHHRDAATDEAFVAPAPDAIAQAHHGGPGNARAVPVLLTTTATTRPHPAAAWQSLFITVPAHDAASGDVVVQLVGRDPMRRKLVLTNSGANALWYAPTREQAQPNACAKLAAGDAITLSSSGPVWATADTGGTDASLVLEIDSIEL